MLRDLTVGQKELAEVMSGISERCYSAGWMRNLEFVLWDAVTTGERKFGHGKITTQDIEEISALSRLCSSWIYFDDDAEETAIDITSWEELFQKFVQEFPETLRG
jgi:hypothetical protein